MGPGFIRNTHVFETTLHLCVTAVQGHSRPLISIPIEGTPLLRHKGAQLRPLTSRKATRRQLDVTGARRLVRNYVGYGELSWLVDRCGMYFRDCWLIAAHCAMNTQHTSAILPYLGLYGWPWCIKSPTHLFYKLLWFSVVFGMYLSQAVCLKYAL